MNEGKSCTAIYWISKGREVYINNLNMMLFGSVIFMIPYLVSIFLAHLPNGKYIVILFNLFILPPVMGGYWYLALKAVREQSPQVNDVFYGFRLFVKVWLTFVITSLIVFAGFFLFFIPAIVWLIKYYFSVFAVVDRGMSPFKAISFSGKTTSGYKMRLLVLFLLGSLELFLTYPFGYGLQHINNPKSIYFIIFGIIPYLTAFLIITPWVTASFATAYDVLSHQNEISANENN